MKKVFGSLIYKYFISYMIIFILAAVFSAAIYGKLSHQMKEEILAANTSMLENIRVQIDGSIEEIYQLSDQISLNNDIRSLVSASKAFSDQNYYDIYKAASYLNNLTMVSTNIDNINIYFTDSGTVLSNSGHTDLSMHLQLGINKNKTLDFKLPDIENILTQRQVRSIVELYSDGACEYLLFVNSIFFPDYNNANAAAFIFIDTEKIMTALESMKWNEKNVALLLNEDNRVICSTESSLFGILPLAEGILYTSADGTKYVVSLAESQSAGWKYVILTPEATFYKEVRDAQKLFFMGIVICAMLCVFVASVLAKRNYRPVKDILSVLQRKKDYNSEKNEYIWIKETVQDFLKESGNVETALARSRRTMKNNIVQALLNGSYKPEGWGEADIDLDIEGGRFAVVLFQVQLTKELAAFDEINSDANILLFIMVNVFDEILSTQLKIAICEFEPYAAAIIEFPCDDEDACKETMEELIYIGKQELKAHFNMDVYVSLSEVHDGAGGIRKSYFEAKEAAEYGVSQKNSEVIVHYNEIKNLKTGYYYPQETEGRLLNALRAGNFESAATIINEVLNRNLNRGIMSRTMKQFLIADIISSFFKSLEENGNIQAANNMELDEGLYDNFQVQVLEERLLQMAMTVCANSKRAVEAEKSDDLSKEVIAFIKKNYHDNNLNVSMIGDHFELTPAYISRLFKEQTGEGLLNYINIVRVEKAKLLLEQGMNVTTVAEQTGFTNASGMIRTFKKITGVTPGQMKKIM